jgi:hypothetical protein
MTKEGGGGDKKFKAKKKLARKDAQGLKKGT